MRAIWWAIGVVGVVLVVAVVLLIVVLSVLNGQALEADYKSCLTAGGIDGMTTVHDMATLAEFCHEKVYG